MTTLPLKRIASVRVSNVDKKSVEGEPPVRLCNYTDVYYRDEIEPGQAFMVATASPEQIAAFRLQPGDVIITKDSETADDIAVPAYVRATASDLICGYHLAMLRPDPQLLDGRFLYWFMSSTTAREQLSVAATGVTRFGLRADSTGGVLVPSWPLDRQRAIADYLDTKTARIDVLIEAESRRAQCAVERLGASTQAEVLGKERREATVNEPNGPLLPVLPGWTIRRNKTFLEEVTDLSESGTEELLSVSHLTGVGPRSEKDVTMFLAESNEGYKRVAPGDLVVNTMWAWMGALGVARKQGIVSPAYGVYRFTDSGANSGYFDALFRSSAYIAEMTRHSKGVWTSRLRLYPESFLALNSPFPPPSEQKRIVDLVDHCRTETERLTRHLNRSVQLLREHRQTLITAAVTGELDVPPRSA